MSPQDPAIDKAQSDVAAAYAALDPAVREALQAHDAVAVVAALLEEAASLLGHSIGERNKLDALMAVGAFASRFIHRTMEHHNGTCGGTVEEFPTTPPTITH